MKRLHGFYQMLKPRKTPYGHRFIVLQYYLLYLSSLSPVDT